LTRGPGQTSLTGNFADQVQLHGLLDQLRDLGIHLISVNPVDQRRPEQVTAKGAQRTLPAQQTALICAVTRQQPIAFSQSADRRLFARVHEDSSYCP